MIREYHQIYEDMIVRLTKKNSPDISNVKKAFAFAEEKHSGQFRKSGEPYILHPICVAEILEKLNFDTDVISAAILHDVIEDCEVTHNQLEKEFNSQIAEIVEAVTAITNETYKPDFENLYSNPQDFLKLAIEDKTYQKLISMGKSNKFAFYIKFADRIHNLSTISVFARHKILAKIEETEKWIIPITILLKSLERITCYGANPLILKRANLLILCPIHLFDRFLHIKFLFYALFSRCSLCFRQIKRPQDFYISRSDFSLFRILIFAPN